MNSKNRNNGEKCKNIQELGPETIVAIEKARARIKRAILNRRRRKIKAQI